MNSLIHDLRFAMRTLVRSPGFAIAAIATLGLGMGATTMVFSGLSTNADWPLGDHEAGGYGYRGGGYYNRGSAETDLNPHSRVEQRPYGSWGGGPRGVAYGFRAARTAE